MISCHFVSWNSNPFKAFNWIYRTFYCLMPAVTGNSRNSSKYRIKDYTLGLHLNLIFINKQLYYLHSCRSHVLAIALGHLNA